MERIFAFLCTVLFVFNAIAAPKVPSPGRVSRYVDPQSYAYMYPYLNNKMRTELNPGVTVNQMNNPIDVVVKTTPMAAPRRVVSRTQKNATTNTKTTNTTPARSATISSPSANTPRRVVPRNGTNTTARAATRGTSVVARTTRRDDGNTQTAGNTTIVTSESVSSTRCLADYMACMDGYCVRENTAYNRCYCSAKLSQIDSQYQPEINDMFIQIINLMGGGQWTSEEMNEYWMGLVGNYAGENSWVNLDNALNIDWPTPDERTRGQNAFLTGHQYCVQHLRACSYMSSNMRDAYRSQISRDCNTYEKSMQKIQNAAAALIEYYSE